MKWLVAVLALCVLAPTVRCASASVEWCYHDPSCNDATWPTIAADHCSGSRQSPINIESTSASADSGLSSFTFTNFDNRSVLTSMVNTGKTIKVNLASGVQVSGGGLSEPYNSLQFHLHWGNGSNIPGSEHTVNGKRYPMEFHIVNLKSSHNGNVTAVLADPTGAAALGFFIEAMPENETGKPESWRTLTSYLANVSEAGHTVTMEPGISLDDLLPGVDRTKYYRYLGSLTTPTCDEVVVWTVFKEPVKVSRDLIDLFSKSVHIGNSTTEHMVNVYRNLQPVQRVTTQPATTEGTSGASGLSSPSCYSLGLMALGLVLGRG